MRQSLATEACEVWLRRTARMKLLDWFNMQKGGSGKALWSAQGRIRHKRASWPSTASDPSPVVLTMSCHWTQMVADERVRSTTRNSSSLKSNSSRTSSDHYQNNQALWRWASGEAIGVGALAVAVANLHTGSSGHMVVQRCDFGAAARFGSPLSN